MSAPLSLPERQPVIAFCDVSRRILYERRKASSRSRWASPPRKPAIGPTYHLGGPRGRAPATGSSTARSTRSCSRAWRITQRRALPLNVESPLRWTTKSVRNLAAELKIPSR